MTIFIFHSTIIDYLNRFSSRLKYTFEGNYRINGLIFSLRMLPNNVVTIEVGALESSAQR